MPTIREFFSYIKKKILMYYLHIGALLIIRQRRSGFYIHIPTMVVTGYIMARNSKLKY